jgi:outer membrane protein assembly factor BamA
MSCKPSIRIILLPILIALVCLASSATAVTPDSSKTREVEPEKKTVGQTMYEIGKGVVTLPVKAVAGFSQFLITGVYENPYLRRAVAAALQSDPAPGIFLVGGFGASKGISFGLGYTDIDIVKPGDRVKLTFSYSTHRYQSYSLKYKHPELFGRDVGFDLLLYYKNRPWETFNGIGFDSKESDEVSYTYEITHLSAGIPIRLHRHLGVTLLGSYSKANIYDGEDDNLLGNLDQIRQRLGLVPAEMRKTTVVSIGGQITHNWRDSDGQPSWGGWEQFALHYVASTKEGDDLAFTLMQGELRYYLNIFKKRLLAFRAMAQDLTYSDDSPVAPFYLRSSLGGESVLRGYKERRFIDNDMALWTIEYRWPIWRMIDAFLFYEKGRVFDSISKDFTFKNWEYSTGFGFRAWQQSGALVALQTAFSKEVTRFYLIVQQDF